MSGEEYLDIFFFDVKQTICRTNKKALEGLRNNAEYRALEGDIEAQEKILEMWTRCLEADNQMEGQQGNKEQYSAKEYNAETPSIREQKLTLIG